MKEHLYSKPWGYFNILSEQKDFKIKKLHINPNQKLSVQSHEKRNELWMVLKGEATAYVNDKVFHVTENQTIHIRKGDKHSLENRTQKALEIIEIQTGSYFGEDDIIRYQDRYGRL